MGGVFAPAIHSVVRVEEVPAGAHAEHVYQRVSREVVWRAKVVCPRSRDAVVAAAGSASRRVRDGQAYALWRLRCLRPRLGRGNSRVGFRLLALDCDSAAVVAGRS